MLFNRPRKSRGGFRNPSELQIVVVFLAIISAFILPVAFKLHLSLLVTCGIILGSFGLFVLLLQHRNIIAWLRGCRWKKKP